MVTLEYTTKHDRVVIIVSTSSADSAPESARILSKHLEPASFPDAKAALNEIQALAHIGSWQWDAASGILAWSDEMYRLYGLDPRTYEISFDDFISRIHPEDREWVASLIYNSLKTKESLDFQHRIVLPDGRERYLHGKGRAATDESGKTIRMYGTSQDITARRQLDNAKDEFLSLVSHQLRTPLTANRISSEMLAMGMAGELTPEQQKLADNIAASNVAMISLVDDILNVSRIELGRTSIEPVVTNINHLIESQLKKSLPMASKRGIDIKFTPDSSLPEIPIDHKIFTIVLDNLLSNAIRYTRAKEGKINVASRQTSKGIVLSVTDNGIGVDKDAQEHIFERFYRADNAASFNSEGTGLGLYLIKLISDYIGAKVWLKSNEDKGSTFYFLLPPKGMKATRGNSRLV